MGEARTCPVTGGTCRCSEGCALSDHWGIVPTGKESVLGSPLIIGMDVGPSPARMVLSTVDADTGEWVVLGEVVEITPPGWDGERLTVDVDLGDGILALGMVSDVEDAPHGYVETADGEVHAAPDPSAPPYVGAFCHNLVAFPGGGAVHVDDLTGPHPRPAEATGDWADVWKREDEER